LGRWSLAGGDVLALSFLPNFKSVAIIRSQLNDQVHIWDFESGQRPPPISTGGTRPFPAGEDPDDYPYAAAANSPDGKMIAASVRAATGRQYVLQLCDLKFGTTLGQLNVVREIGTYGKRIEYIGFSKDGSTIASADTGNTVCIWEKSSGRQVGSLTTPAPIAAQGTNRAIALSADGRTIAVGMMDQTIGLWKLADSSKPMILRGHQQQISALVFSPDGESLASAGRDRTIHVWDVSRGQERQRLEGHHRWVEALSYSPDGRRLYSGGQDCIVRVWDLDSGKQIGPIGSPDDWILAMAMSGDRKYLATGEPDGWIGLWEADTGNLLGRWKAHPRWVRALSFSHDNKKLASTGVDEAVRIWTLPDGKPGGSLAVPGKATACGSCAYSEDGRLMVASVDGNVVVWDVSGPMEKIQHRFPLEYVGPGDSGCVRVSADGGVLAAAMLMRRRNANSNIVHVWNLDRRRSDLLESDLGTIEHLATSKDGRWLAVVGSPHEIPVGVYRDVLCLHDLARGGPHRLLTTENMPEELRHYNIQDLAFSPDGRTLASAERTRITFWEVATGGVRHQQERAAANSFMPSRIAFSADGRRFASSGSDLAPLVWDWTRLGFEQANVKPSEVEQHWKEIAGADAVKAYQAILALSHSPDSAKFIRGRLHPAVEDDFKKVRRLATELDSNDFATRERATSELARVGSPATLRQLLTSNTSAEARDRITALLQKVDTGPAAAERIRTLRALEVLERTSSSESKEVLAWLATGSSEAELTQEARASLERLGR
jgi:WD40 repeat protein